MPETLDADSEALLNFLRMQKGSGSLQSAPAPTNAPSAAAQPDSSNDLLPLTRQTVNSLINAIPQVIEVSGNPSWFDRNQRKDESGRVIPIDIKSGLDLGPYARMVAQRRPEDRITVLRKMFPNNLIRQADTGEPIMETTDANGRRQDVLVNPVGMDLGDVADIVEQSAAPTVGGAIGIGVGQAVGARVLGPPGAAIGKVIGGAIGSGIGGAIEDVAARGAESLPIQPTEIVQSQAKLAALNAMFDAGAWVGAKSMRAFSPFAGSKGPLQFNLEKGKEYFRNVHGVDFQTTPAEEIGEPILARLEATESKLPGAMSAFGKIYEKGQAQLARIYNTALGRRVGDEQLGSDIMDTVRRNLVEPVEADVAQARKALLDKGENELAGIIDSLAATPATKKEAGEAIRTAFEAERKARKGTTDAAYAAVRALPGGTKKILPGDPVADAADAIMDELPAVLNTKVVKGYDAYGNPIAKTKVSKEILESGRPAGLMTFLSDMQAQRGQKMTIDELTKLKNAAHDEIAKTEAVPDVKDRWFNKIASAYDDAISQGLDAMPTSPLKNALQNAKDTYKALMRPLDREGLHDIMRTEFESGFQAPEQLVNRLFSGVRAEHNLRVLEDVLGPGNPVFDKVKRSIFDTWKGSALDPVTQRINPSKLESSMLEMRAAHPTIYDKVVGPNEQSLFKITASLRAARKEISDVDPEELSELLSRGSPTQREVQALMDAQKQRDTKLASVYLKDLQTGKPRNSPSEFVSSLFNSKIDSQHLQEVLSTLSPAQMEDLQTAALYRVATRASESNVDMAKFLAGQQSPVQAFALAKALGPVGSLERQRNELLLGPDYQALVRNTIGVLAPREVKTGLFSAAGGMAATGIIEKLLSMPFKYVETWAKKTLAASLYTSETTKKLLANSVEGPMETAAFANALIASEPFIRKLSEVYGDDAAFSIVQNAKGSIDRFIAESGQPSRANAEQAELVKFLQGEKAKVRTNVVR